MKFLKQLVIVLAVFVVPTHFATKAILAHSGKAAKKVSKRYARPQAIQPPVCTLTGSAQSIYYVVETDVVIVDWNLKCFQGSQNTPCKFHYVGLVYRLNLTNQYKNIDSVCQEADPLDCGTSDDTRLTGITNFSEFYGNGQYLVIFYVVSGDCANPGTIVASDMLLFTINNIAL